MEFAALEQDWLISTYRKYLLSLLKTRILTQQHLEISSAICLGLGSPSKGRRCVIRFPRLCKKFDEIEDNDISHSDCTYLNSNGENKGREDTCRYINKTVGLGFDQVERNDRLFQLLLFVTVIECLRKLSLYLNLKYILYFLTDITIKVQNLVFKIHFFKTQTLLQPM